MDDELENCDSTDGVLRKSTVHVHRPLPDPLLSMVLASALAFDAALQQN